MSERFQERGEAYRILAMAAAAVAIASLAAPRNLGARTASWAEVQRAVDRTICSREDQWKGGVMGSYSLGFPYPVVEVALDPSFCPQNAAGSPLDEAVARAIDRQRELVLVLMREDPRRHFTDERGNEYLGGYFYGAGGVVIVGTPRTPSLPRGIIVEKVREAGGGLRLLDDKRLSDVRPAFVAFLLRDRRIAEVLMRGVADELAALGIDCSDCPLPAERPRRAVTVEELMPYLLTEYVPSAKMPHKGIVLKAVPETYRGAAAWDPELHLATRAAGLWSEELYERSRRAAGTVFDDKDFRKRANKLDKPGELEAYRARIWDVLVEDSAFVEAARRRFAEVLPKLGFACGDC